MEVFVKEKNMPKSCIDCEFCITTNIKNGHTKKYEEITQCCFGEYYKLDKINTCPLKSLDQHDSELKAKWCDELLEWSKNCDGGQYALDEETVVDYIHRIDLQSKLTEIKEINNMELYLVEMVTRGVENEKLYVVAESFNKARELAESEHITWEVVSIEIIANKNMSNLIMEGY